MSEGGVMNKLLCWLGFHKIHYTWKAKSPYCARSENCEATNRTPPLGTQARKSSRGWRG